MNILIANPAFSIDLGNGFERLKLGSGMRYPWSLLKRKTQPPRYAMFPLFLAYSAALAEKKGFSVHVIDAIPLNMSQNDFVERVQKIDPDILLFEPNIAVIEDLIALLTILRRKVKGKFVLVGSHVTATADFLLKRYPIIDFIIAGEYEFAFIELISNIRDTTPTDSIKGLSFRNDSGLIQSNGKTDPIDPLDALPLPARHLFPGVYHDGFCQFSPSFHMHTSRGCRFRCTFCDRVHNFRPPDLC